MALVVGDCQHFMTSEAFSNLGLSDEQVLGMGEAKLSSIALDLALVVCAASRMASKFLFVDVMGGEERWLESSTLARSEAATVWRLLGAADSIVERDGIFAVQALLSVLPSALLGFRMNWMAAALDRAAAEMTNLLDLERALWLGDEPLTSGSVRSRPQLMAMKNSHIFSLCQSYESMSRSLSVKSLAISAANRAEYLSIARAAAGSASADRFDSQAIVLFAWWASYFRARALLFERSGDFANAMSSLVREIELVFQCLLLESRDAEFDSSGAFLLKGRSVEGVGEIVGFARATVARQVGEDLFNRLTAGIGCRNRSKAGHGVSALNADIFQDCVQAMTAVWRVLDVGVGNCPAVLRQLQPKAVGCIVRRPSRILASDVFGRAGL